MKKPVVDYRQFRLSRLNDPQFSHLKLLLGWVVYFLFYFLTENFIPPESCHLQAALRFRSCSCTFQLPADIVPRTMD